jgi:hypothetical protein
VSAGIQPEPVHRRSGRGRSRRALLRALYTLGVVAGTSAALAPLLRAGRRDAGEAPGGGEVRDEMYRGRHIRITGAARPAPGAAAPDIRIDGRPLRVMRRADGSYLSVVNHYESFATPLEAARAAVDDLGGAQLSLSGPTHHT